MKNSLPYLECHAVRHDWDEWSINRGASYGVTVEYRCTNCFATKREVYSRQSGILLSRYYYLPKDYRGPTGTTKADYRKAYFAQRLKDKLRVVS
jgi:hypothetical protein